MRITNFSQANFDIFEAATGQKIGSLDSQAHLTCLDPRHRAALERVVGQDLLTYQPDEPEFGDVIDEGQMCYFATLHVRPTDPDYLKVLVTQLPVLTRYEVRPALEEAEFTGEHDCW